MRCPLLCLTFLKVSQHDGPLVHFYVRIIRFYVNLYVFLYKKINV